MDLPGFGTPFGLAFASGLNAYLPLLAYSISVRWLNLYKVNPNFAFITQNWFIALLVVLTILDFVADKIPVVDHIWGAIHTVVRPIAGAVVAAAASSHYLSGSPGISLISPHFFPAAGTALAPLSTTSIASAVIPVTGVVLLVIILIGGALAAISHITKSTTRVFSTIATLGFFNIGLSVIEDILVVIFILLSLFASAIMLILLVVIVLFLVPKLVRSPRNRR